MLEPHRERVRQYLLKRLARCVREPSSGGLGLIPRSFFSSTEGTYAFDYSACDAERPNCIGEVQGASLIESDGMRPAEVTPGSVPGERRGMWYWFNRVQFYISPGGDWAVLASLAGPRAGRGGLPELAGVL
jgi:hypothetical protein